MNVFYKIYLWFYFTLYHPKIWILYEQTDKHPTTGQKVIGWKEVIAIDTNYMKLVRMIEKIEEYYPLRYLWIEEADWGWKFKNELYDMSSGMLLQKAKERENNI